MAMIKFNRNRFPWKNDPTDFFDGDTIFNDDFFNLEKSLPALNVKEVGDRFELELAAPGFNKDDFKITLDNDVLEVSADKKGEEETIENDYARREFNYRSFRRALQLPKTVDDSKGITATYTNGILKLDLLKKEESKERQKRMIEVK